MLSKAWRAAEQSVRSNTLQAGSFRTNLPLWGKADSPLDGLRPSSAQRSICREDCAWTAENPQIRQVLLVDKPTLTRRRSVPFVKARQSFISAVRGRSA